MAKAAEVAGDIVAAGGALSGLILVYIGALSTSYGSYEPQEKRAVRSSHLHRAWFAFVGLVLFLLSVFLGLLGKWLDLTCTVIAAAVLLACGAAWVIVVAILTIKEIR